jgi:hypothetical protein
MNNLGVVDTCTGPRGGRRWQLPESTANATDAHAHREALAEKVASAFQSAFSKLEEHKADIEKLWKEFECLRSGETIMGCKAKTEFCTKVLHRTPRAVQYLIYGREQCSHVRVRHDSTRPAGKLWLSRKQKDRLLNAAAIVGTELLPAYKSGHDIENSLKELEKIAFDSKELNSLLEEGSYSAIESISYSQPELQTVCSLNDELLSESRTLARAVLERRDYAELTAVAARVLSLTDATSAGEKDTEPLNEEARAALEDEALYVTNQPTPETLSYYPWLAENRAATPRELQRFVRIQNKRRTDVLELSSAQNAQSSENAASVGM